MKYSIRLHNNVHHLYRYKEDKGPANNAEVEFWCESQDLKQIVQDWSLRLQDMQNKLPKEIQMDDWEVGGPYPSTSIITNIEGGYFGPDGGEPPYCECVCMLDEKTEGEQSPIMVAIAEWIVTCNDVAQEIIKLTKADDLDEN
jgi:hypothetical protein